MTENAAPSGPENWTEIASLADFPPNTRRCVDVDGVQMVVFNIGGEFHAIEDLCSHEAEALSGGRLEGTEIVCPRHEACPSTTLQARLDCLTHRPIHTQSLS